MTSIEWLINAMENPNKNINWQDTKQQAKEMHKQEIIDAYDKGEFNDGIKEFAEQYYKETFVSKGSDDHISDISKMVEDKSLISNIDYWEKTLKYWKEEKELSILGSTYYSNCCARIGILEDIFKCIESIQQLPQQEISDEEIEKGAEDWQEFRQGAGKQSFEAGAKWYREQLKQRQ
jgi:hypothetical protein